MKKLKKQQINVKSELGITMFDLIGAIAVFTIFTGVISSLFYLSYKMNFQTRLSGEAINYAIMILEDIDKISYEQVKNGLEDEYITKFSIPSGFKLSIEVKNYNEGNDKKDIIKIVKLTISYTYQGVTEDTVIEKMKIREIEV